ncbi:hypothetical protein RCL1_000295 [Eukaryota sp. TZLM3-RCL]
MNSFIVQLIQYESLSLHSTFNSKALASFVRSFFFVSNSVFNIACDSLFLFLSKSSKPLHLSPSFSVLYFFEKYKLAPSNLLLSSPIPIEHHLFLEQCTPSLITLSLSFPFPLIYSSLISLRNLRIGPGFSWDNATNLIDRVGGQIRSLCLQGITSIYFDLNFPILRKLNTLEISDCSFLNPEVNFYFTTSNLKTFVIINCKVVSMINFPPNVFLNILNAHNCKELIGINMSSRDIFDLSLLKCGPRRIQINVSAANQLIVLDSQYTFLDLSSINFDCLSSITHLLLPLDTGLDFFKNFSNSFQNCVFLRLCSHPISDLNNFRRFPKLQNVEIIDYPALTSIDFSTAPRLVTLSIEKCHNLRSIKGLLNLENLYEFSLINSPNLENLSLTFLRNLTFLNLSLSKLPAFALPNLRVLQVFNISEQNLLKFSALINLIDLKIVDSTCLITLTGINHLSKLTSLSVVNCRRFNPNSSTFMQSFSLKKLVINCCPEINSLNFLNNFLYLSFVSLRFLSNLIVVEFSNRISCVVIEECPRVSSIKNDWFVDCLKFTPCSDSQDFLIKNLKEKC